MDNIVIQIIKLFIQIQSKKKSTSLLDYLKDHQVPCGFTEENTKILQLS